MNSNKLYHFVLEKSTLYIRISKYNVPSYEIYMLKSKKWHCGGCLTYTSAPILGAVKHPPKIKSTW